MGLYESFVRGLANFFRAPVAEPVVRTVGHISDETNNWNKLALELARQQLPVYPTSTPEQAKRRQERTFELNRIALDYAQRRG